VATAEEDRLTMKKLLLTGIAALSVLSASAAHARSYTAYHCGKHELQSLAAKYFIPPCSHKICDREGHVLDENNNVVDRWFRMKGEEAYYKGRKCRPWTEEEYGQ